MPDQQADELTHHLAAHWGKGNWSDADRALCEFAVKLTNSPANMTENHILELRSFGLSDGAIHDAAQVISYFNYINRIADSLNVDLEDDVHHWEQSVPA